MREIPSIVEVTSGEPNCEGPRGTAFAVTADLIVTAGHVVDGAAEVTLALPAGRRTAQVVQTGEGADWAVLRLTAHGLPPLVTSELQPSGVTPGATTWRSFGFPAGASHGIAVSGTIETTVAMTEAGRAIQLLCMQAQGGLDLRALSGAPVIVDGVVVGIIREALTDFTGRRPAGLTLFAEPIVAARQAAGLGPTDRRARIPGLPGRAYIDLPDDPFRDLARYEAQHAALFFGRAAALDTLFSHVQRRENPRIILVYGASGVGKSSLFEAGFAPRAAQRWQVAVVRRQGRTLSEALEIALGGPATLAQWQSRERRFPLIVVIDQVEEAFRPADSDGEPTDEYDRFVDAIERIQRRGPPSGHLVLGFRREWLDRVQQPLRERGLPCAHVPLGEMTPMDVSDVIAGLTSDARLRLRYPLRLVPEDLPTRLAAALEGRTLAPAVLQVAFSHLWSHAVPDASGARTWHLDVVVHALRDGGGLGAFLERQLAFVARERRADAARGLHLDVLRSHASSVGAEALTRQELEARYAHVDHAAVRDVLVAARLLVATDSGTRLVHDTLAARVRAVCRRSDLPGQRARRVWDRNRAEGESAGARPRLHAWDLGLWLRGRRGMRRLEPDERQVVRRTISRLAGLVSLAIAVLAIVAVGVVTSNRRALAQVRLESALLRARTVAVQAEGVMFHEDRSRAVALHAAAAELERDLAALRGDALPEVTPAGAAAQRIRSSGVPLRRVVPTPESVVEVLPSPDGTMLVEVHGDGRITRADLGRGGLRSELGAIEGATLLGGEWDSSGELLIFGDTSGRAYALDTSGRQLGPWTCGGAPVTVGPSPHAGSPAVRWIGFPADEREAPTGVDRERFLVATAAGRVCAFDLSKEAPVWVSAPLRFEPQAEKAPNRLFALAALSRDGRWVAIAPVLSGYDEVGLVLVDTATGEVVARRTAMEGRARGLDWRQDRLALATQSWEASDLSDVWSWRIRNVDGAPSFTDEQVDTAGRAASWLHLSPDAAWMAYERDGRYVVRDEDGQIIFDEPRLTAMSSAALSGRRLLVASNDGEILVGDVPSGRTWLVATRGKALAGPRPFGDGFGVQSVEPEYLLWDGGAAVGTWLDHPGAPDLDGSGLAWHAATGRAARFGTDGRVVVWDRAGRVLWTVRVDENPIASAVFDSSGALLVATVSEGLLQLDPIARTLTIDWSPPDGDRITRLVADPRERFVAAATTAGEVYILGDDGQKLETATHATVSFLEVSADGSRLLALPMTTGGATTWDTRTWARVDVANTQGPYGLAATLAPDGRAAAVAQENWFRVVDAASGQALPAWSERTLHRAPVTALRFRGTDRLLSADNQGVVREWDLTTGQIVWEHVLTFPIGDVFPLDDERVLVMGGNRPATVVVHRPTGEHLMDLPDGLAGYGIVMAGSEVLVALQDGSFARWLPPQVDPDGALAALLRRTNLRTCRGSLEVVPVVPFPKPADGVWAPADLCP